MMVKTAGELRNKKEEENAVEEEIKKDGKNVKIVLCIDNA